MATEASRQKRAEHADPADAELVGDTRPPDETPEPTPPPAAGRNEHRLRLPPVRCVLLAPRCSYRLCAVLPRTPPRWPSQSCPVACRRRGCSDEDPAGAQPEDGEVQVVAVVTRPTPHVPCWDAYAYASHPLSPLGTRSARRVLSS